MIRLATSTDLPALQEIEVAAGAPFRDIGMSAIADDPPPTIADLEKFLGPAHIWVATGDDDRPIAYALMEVVDAAAHIEKVSVHPDHARRGLGARLIDEIGNWANGHQLPALTLTTFADVPWNAPYYERLGFRRLADSDLTPGLVRIREREAQHGLDAWPRVTMRRPVAT